jgi:hypothetical protein
VCKGEEQEGVGIMPGLDILKEAKSGMSMAMDKMCSITSDFNNLVGSTLAVGELSDSASANGGIAVDLDICHNKVTNDRNNVGAQVIGT